MSRVTTAQKAAVVARVAGRQIRNSRTLGAVGRGIGATLRSWVHVLRQLWLEVVGVVFLAMAGSGAMWLVREFSKRDGLRPAPGRTAVAVCFILLFAWFGVSSFWRVRRNTAKSRN